MPKRAVWWSWTVGVVFLALATLAHAQPPPGVIRATAPNCTFAARRCMTRIALDRRVQDKKLDGYCDAWKVPCLDAGYSWGGPAK